MDDYEDSDDEPQQQPANVPPPATSTPPMPQGASLEAIMAQLQLLNQRVNVIMDTQLEHGQVISSMVDNIDDLRRLVRPFGGASSSGQGNDIVESSDEDE